MLSKRLKLIASFVDTDNVVDVGCDHALLDIYLTKQGKKCIASDISNEVLKITKDNISKYHMQDKIEVVMSDGLQNITLKENSTVIIAGMGTYTIIDILKNNKQDINTLIIQSNNDLYLLRKFVTNNGYYIEKEEAILDKGKYYVIIKFKKGNKKYTKKDYLLGNLDKEYYKYLLDKNNEILKHLKLKHIKKRIKLLKENYFLKQKLH